MLIQMLVFPLEEVLAKLKLMKMGMHKFSDSLFDFLQ